ncbi:MAG: type VI secretion system-associated FHA domain protein TagH [Gammaproteobacteria bacterium]|nr:type VI secretion system-associated FHA domain protein TagH [Gammaproteobacteria bacterium]
MGLILSVLADPQGANMLKHTKLFTSSGGSFGRSESNDWVLPDPERVVSSKHGLISFAKGQYFLTDNSTNGSYHNQSADPIGKGNKVALKEGDIISFGEYKLKVALQQPQAEQSLPGGLAGADFLDDSDRTSFSAAAMAKMKNQVEAKELDSWLDPGSEPAIEPSGEWGFVAGEMSEEAPLIQGFNTVDPLVVMNTPAFSLQENAEALSGGLTKGLYSTEPFAAGQDTDDDWWKESSEPDHAPAHQQAIDFAPQQQKALKEPAAPQPPPHPEPFQPAIQPQAEEMASPQSFADNPFSESLKVVQKGAQGVPGFDTEVATSAEAAQSFSQPQAAVPTDNTASSISAALGLSSALPSPQLDQQVAAIVQETAARLIDLLRARTSIKNELRVQRTMVQVQANNPLKFSANSTDALNAMFADNSAFMSPQQAIKDGFDDLSDHQVAVLAGMRAGFDAMLNFFHPQKIEQRLNSPSGLLSNKNAKNWEGFSKMYKELVHDQDACYRRLFGDEFAETYERQLSELKNARNFNG